MKLRTKLIFAAIVFAVIFLSSALGGCSTAKNGCPGAHSQGRVPGKFNK